MDEAEDQISPAEKKALIDDILSSNPFRIRGKEVRGQRAREILAYLFKRYCESPSGQVTERDLYLKIFREDPDPHNTKVRSAVVRLRALLARYFCGRGARREIRLTIPQGGYSLDFTRKEIQRDIFDWFWGPYLYEQQRVAFGIVPHSFLQRDPLPYVKAYARFAEMLSDHAMDLEILPRVLPPGFFEQEGRRRLMSIFIGGEDALVGDPHAYNVSETDGLRFLARYSSVNYRMFRDPAGHTAIARRTAPLGKPATIVDNEIDRHVLFTRAVAVKHRSTVSLLMARHLDSCVAVADLLTSASGLEIVASHPVFNTYGGLYAAPLEMQIVFSTASKLSDDHCYSSDVSEEFNHVGIVDCCLESVDSDEDEGDDD